MPSTTNDEHMDLTKKKLEVDRQFPFSKIEVLICRQPFVIQQFKWVVGQRRMIIY